MTNIGILNSASNEYRELILNDGDAVVPLRPSPDHQWQGDQWVHVPPPRDVAAEVAAHALKLKIGVVNATRTDGKTDPETPEALAAVVERYTRLVAEFNTDVNLGETVTDERKATVRLIRDGERFFDAVDAAAEAILSAGDAADPIHSDSRWPQIPTGS